MLLFNFQAITSPYLRPYYNGNCNLHVTCLACIVDASCGWCSVSSLCIRKSDWSTCKTPELKTSLIKTNRLSCFQCLDIYECFACSQVVIFYHFSKVLLQNCVKISVKPAISFSCFCIVLLCFCSDVFPSLLFFSISFSSVFLTLVCISLLCSSHFFLLFSLSSILLTFFCSPHSLLFFSLSFVLLTLFCSYHSLLFLFLLLFSSALFFTAPAFLCSFCFVFLRSAIPVSFLPCFSWY